jgi:hypothetical protein
VTWTASPPAGSISGGGAFQAYVTYPAGQNNEDFEIPLPANTDLTGKVVTFNIYVEGALGGTYGGIQTYVKAGSLSTFCNAAWVNIPSFNTWNQFQINLSTTCTSNLTDVRAVGVQIFVGGVTTPAAGHIFIDDVTVTTAVPPTNTPTPTGLGWNYEDGTAQYWAAVASSGTCTGAVTAFGDASTYGFNILIPDGVTTGAANDFRAVCNAASGSPVIGSGMNWTTLALSSVTMRYYVSAAIGNYASTLYPYLVAGAGPTTYGGTYNGWVGECNGTCPYVAASAWQTVTFTPSGGSWATDKTNVTAVGVDINLTAPVTLTNGYFVIDNITLQ